MAVLQIFALEVQQPASRVPNLQGDENVRSRDYTSQCRSMDIKKSVADLPAAPRVDGLAHRILCLLRESRTQTPIGIRSARPECANFSYIGHFGG